MLSGYPFKASCSKGSADCEYRFITKHNLNYLVYLIDVTKIIDILDAYPVLSNGIFLGIELLSGEDLFTVFDSDIGVTVSNILKDYLERYGYNSIIIYNCYEKDGKQQKRYLKFKRWFSLYAADTGFIFHHQTFLEEVNNETLIPHFITILYSATHPRKEYIEREIQNLEAWLMSEKE